MPWTMDEAELAEVARDVADHPFYVAALSDGFPFGDDYDAKDPEEGPVYYASVDDAREVAAKVRVPAGIYRRTARDGYPDPADPRVDA